MFKKEIEEKIIHVKDADGIQPDLSHYPEIDFLINGASAGITTEHLFRSVDMEQEVGEIYGCTLLSYFTPQEDGSLMEPEGNKIQLVLKESNTPLLVTEISRPALTDDKKINMDYLLAFCELVGITKGDELFADLLTEEGKTFIANARAEKQQKQTEADTAAANLQSKQQAQEEYNGAILEGDEHMKNENLPEAKECFTRAKQIAEDAKAAGIELEFKPESSSPEGMLAAIAEKETEAQAIAAKQKEEEVRASIDPEFLVDEKKYKLDKHDYAELGFTVFSDGTTDFFYSKEWREYKTEPFIYVKRGSNFWENVENDLDTDDNAIIETEKEVKLAFLDGEERKVAVIDLEKGTLTVTKESEPVKE